VNADIPGMLRDGRWVQPLSAAGVLGIGAAAFLLSYDALHSLALASGVRPGLARIWPGVLDGFIVVATLTIVAAKRASRPTWYPWTLVVLFAAASVAFNILHALGRFLAAARWVGPLVFAMPPLALVLATHLLLQQGAWQRQHARHLATTANTAPAGDRPPDLGGTVTLDPSTSPTAERAQPPPAGSTGPAVPVAGAAPNASAIPDDAATRDRARRLYQDATAAGRKLTGAQLGRAIGRSDRYGRLLLREFRATHPAAGNGNRQQQQGTPQ
jgi:hypothetical protein